MFPRKNLTLQPLQRIHSDALGPAALPVPLWVSVWARTRAPRLGSLLGAQGCSTASDPVGSVRSLHAFLFEITHQIEEIGCLGYHYQLRI